MPRMQEEARALITAITEGDRGKVVELVDKEAVINTKDDNSGHIPLQVAAQIGSMEFVRLLLDKGADINLTNDFGTSALHLSILGGHEEVTRLLLDEGADINLVDSNDNSPLHFFAAAPNVNTELVCLFLDSGADIHLSNSHGNLALHIAALTG